MQKSRYNKQADALTARLRELGHTNAQTVEEAVANAQIVCNAFGMEPAGADAYDYCPNHPTTVRFREQCPHCE